MNKCPETLSKPKAKSDGRIYGRNKKSVEVASRLKKNIYFAFNHLSLGKKDVKIRTKPHTFLYII